MSDSEKGSSTTGPLVGGGAPSFVAQNGPNAAGQMMTSVSPVNNCASTSSQSVTGSTSATAANGGLLNGTSANSHHHSHVYPSMYKDTTYTKIFVGGLPYHTTDKTLRDYFEVFGDIEEAVVITDRQTAKSRGYGFVTMLDRASAERACKEPNPIIDGRKANVNLAYLGAKPRTNGQLDGVLTALQARAAAGGFNPFLQNPLGYPSPYLYPSPILISPNLFLSNGHSSSSTTGGHNSSPNGHSSLNAGQNGSHNQNNGGSNLSSSTTSPPPPNNAAQSYYDFSTAAALAAAASSFVQQHHQFPQYNGGFGDPSGSLYNFGPYAGLLSSNYLQMNQGAPAAASSSPSSSVGNSSGGSSGYTSHLVAAATLRGDK